MNIFGIGPMEMGVIAVIALMIFGPAKLPEVMGQAGKAVADFRRMTAGFQKEFEGTMKEARKITGEFQKEVNSITGTVSPTKAKTTSKTTTTSTKKPTTSATKSSSTTTSRAGSKTSSGTNAAKSTSTSSSTTTSTKAATPVASREDPSADFSLFEPTIPTRKQRVRTAAPAAITDLLPRQTVVETEEQVAAVPVVNDAVARARQRRASSQTQLSA